MTRYIAIINNDEAVDNGDEQGYEDIKFELGELIRSGYYELEQLVEEFDVYMLDIEGMTPSAD